MFIICPYNIQNLLNSSSYLIYYPHRYNIILTQPYSYSYSTHNIEALYLLFLMSFVVTIFTCVSCHSKGIKNKKSQESQESQESQTFVKAEIV